MQKTLSVPFRKRTLPESIGLAATSVAFTLVLLCGCVASVALVAHVIYGG